MSFAFLRVSLVLIGLVWALPISAGEGPVPAWLGGPPDVEMRADRCGVYRWFLDQADRQTEGHASREELASQRVINIANKLIDHHLSNPEERYGARVKYLVIGPPGPFHFEFQVDRQVLDGLIDEDCGE